MIEPTSGIHTFFMAFPIDVAFVAKDGQVVATPAHAEALAARAVRPQGPLRGRVAGGDAGAERHGAE
ncbi:MAG: hypothetical protein U0232_25490 [Thermomicrobiales bacterium]